MFKILVSDITPKVQTSLWLSAAFRTLPNQLIEKEKQNFRFLFPKKLKMSNRNLGGGSVDCGTFECSQEYHELPLVRTRLISLKYSQSPYREHLLYTNLLIMESRNVHYRKQSNPPFRKPVRKHSFFVFHYLTAR